MLISLNLLKKYINIKNIPLKKIVEKINISGFEVEDIKDTNIKNLVVGEIKKKNSSKYMHCFSWTKIWNKTNYLRSK